MKHIAVTATIIENEQGEILVCKCAANDCMVSLLDFPRYKLENVEITNRLKS